MDKGKSNASLLEWGHENYTKSLCKQNIMYDFKNNQITSKTSWYNQNVNFSYKSESSIICTDKWATNNCKFP